MTNVTIAGEGACDLRAIEAITDFYSLKIQAKYDCRGKPNLDKRLSGFLTASAYSPWIILRDLDQDATCPAALITTMHITAPPLCRFRIVVRAIEAWLLADWQGLSDWLKVKPSLIPSQPELLANPKQSMAQLAAHSKSRTLRNRLVARPEDGSIVGPEYGSALYEFIDKHWDPERAVRNDRSQSLARAFAKIGELAV